MNSTKSVTLAAVSAMCYASEMADNLAFGEVAEWFKAAVLKTAPENIGTPRKTAEVPDFCRADSDVLRPFAKNIPAHNSAQEA